MASANQCLLFICVALLHILGALPSQAAFRSLHEASMYRSYEQWMSRYGRVYENSVEKDKRFKIFKQNVEHIESFNNAANKLYKLALNEFADLTNDEFKATRNRFKSHVCSPSTASFSYQLFICVALILILEASPSQATSRSLNEASMYERYEQWMSRYGRVYKNSVEKDTRFDIFKQNVEHIESFNRAASKPYKLAVNEFADLTNDEFKATRNRFKSHVCPPSTASFRYENVTAIPPTMDWRKKGAVTPVKDQGQCGCCWAFSAVAAMEGVTQLKTGKLISLSEQELVDCDTSGEDQGCEGGLMDNAFDFIQQNHGLSTEANYPYQGVDSTCNTNKEANHAAKITGHEDVPANSESALLKAVANQPISVAIDAGGSDFQFYSSGVFTGECGTELDHGVTAVGYGTSKDGTKYWLVKNSWGTGWGEEGYIRMQRGVAAAEGLCGIAMDASYPTA
ncbi:hypothetical protein LguiA_035100 [Lonicera macranthoides]